MNCPHNSRRCGWILRSLLFTALIGLLIAPYARAEVLEELRAAFLQESQYLNVDIEEYGTARSAEKAAIAELQRVNALLDEALEDPNSGYAELVRLNEDAAFARVEAFEFSERSAEARNVMYERMKLIADLLREVDREGIDLVSRSGAVGGMWRIEVQPTDAWGMLSLQQQRQLITGTYRLSNGRRGSVRGTFAGGLLEFEMVDSERGRVGRVEGELDPDSRVIEGTWRNTELAAGRPAAGSWSARQLSAREELGFE